jgi:hypothetical protein
MKSFFLREIVSLVSLTIFFWLAMCLALRSIILSQPNIRYVVLMSLIGYAICRITSMIILFICGKVFYTNDWIFGALALLSVLFFYCYVLLGASV